MDEHERLAARFEATRGHLRSVAYRMLGTRSEAEDAVQEAWLRLSRSDSSGVENLGGWLTTVVARICLDMLRARRSRREDPGGARVPEVGAGVDPSGPEHDALLADSVGVALLVVLDSLAPAERLAFVLHDMFDLPFDEIAPIVGCSPAAARQLASRARRRVQGATVDPDADLTRQREVVDAFLAASRGGDLSALLAVLDPDVVLRADAVAVSESLARRGEGAPPLAPEVRGAAAVAGAFLGRAHAAGPALVNESLAVVWAPGGQPRAVIGLTMVRGKIAAVDVVADPDRLAELDVALLDSRP
jgi:RNA polymerase sigma-70 factor (ECF subfamily)